MGDRHTRFAYRNPTTLKLCYKLQRLEDAGDLHLSILLRQHRRGCGSWTSVFTASAASYQRAGEALGERPARKKLVADET